MNISSAIKFSAFILAPFSKIYGQAKQNSVGLNTWQALNVENFMLLNDELEKLYPQLNIQQSKEEGNYMRSNTRIKQCTDLEYQNTRNLVKACEKGDLIEVKRLIEVEKTDPTRMVATEFHNMFEFNDHTGPLPVHAAKSGNVALMKYFHEILRLGLAGGRVLYGKKHTALSNAALGGHADLVNYLLNKGMDPNASLNRERSSTVLSQAIRSGSLPTVKAIIETGKVVMNPFDISGALEQGNYSVIAYLLEKNAEAVNPVDLHGIHGSKSFSQIAAMSGCTESLELLVNTYGLDPLDAPAITEQNGKFPGYALVSSAMISGSLDMVNYVVETLGFDLKTMVMEENKKPLDYKFVLHRTLLGQAFNGDGRHGREINRIPLAQYLLEELKLSPGTKSIKEIISDIWKDKALKNYLTNFNANNNKQADSVLIIPRIVELAKENHLSNEDVCELILQIDLAIDQHIPEAHRSLDMTMYYSFQLMLDQLKTLQKSGMQLDGSVIALQEKISSALSQATSALEKAALDGKKINQVWLKGKYFLPVLKETLEKREDLANEQTTRALEIIDEQAIPLSGSLCVKLFHNRAQVFIKTDEQFVAICHDALGGNKPKSFLGSHASLADGLQAARSQDVARQLMDHYGVRSTIAKDTDKEGNKITTYQLDREVTFSLNGFYRMHPVSNSRFAYADSLWLHSDDIDQIKQETGLDGHDGLLPMQYVRDQHTGEYAYQPDQYHLHITVNEGSRAPEESLQRYLDENNDVTMLDVIYESISERTVIKAAAGMQESTMSHFGSPITLAGQSNVKRIQPGVIDREKDCQLETQGLKSI